MEDGEDLLEIKSKINSPCLLQLNYMDEGNILYSNSKGKRTSTYNKYYYGVSPFIYLDHGFGYNLVSNDNWITECYKDFVGHHYQLDLKNQKLDFFIDYSICRNSFGISFSCKNNSAWNVRLKIFFAMFLKDVYSVQNAYNESVISFKNFSIRSSKINRFELMDIMGREKVPVINTMLNIEPHEKYKYSLSMSIYKEDI